MNAPGIDIHLVPVGPQGYELYCEVDARVAARGQSGGGRPRGRLSSAFHRGTAWIEAERHRRQERAHQGLRRGWLPRWRDRVVAWMAERVAEQRLLWHLRSESAASVHHPDDLTEGDASAIVKGSLRRDARRHTVWAIIDAGVYLAFLPLTLFPGPNVPAFYFGFRALGHLLSALGAWHGLSRVAWRYVPSAEMTRLRLCAGMAAQERDALAGDVASRLGLRHLATFVERLTAGRPML